ncbi:calcium-activated potassium channel subunit beta-2 isoform X6 [Hemibagrus wyckioides]|uniref:calcium-activated potassium channel subunit beta-2 isoform X6 n=1 Tax=Hemibagrus wyckioides TaxID=337641 RepID=UPI00266B560F|nr:calcium-activated potassium channel subunit beta-2 isoform X6 [Hemibagrus wyckioides]
MLHERHVKRSVRRDGLSQQSLSSTLESAGRMFLWAGSKGPQGSGNERSVWTEESSCTVLNATIIGEINCSYSCGAECRKSSRYPCLQVYVSLNSSGRILKLSHNEETQEDNPECFFVPKCRKDHSTMHALVLNISERLKVQQQVRCYTDPAEQQDSAILTRLYGRAAILSSLLWPTCTLVIGVLIVAMVKLTQYLSILCERISRIKRTDRVILTSASHFVEGSKKCSRPKQDQI